MVKPQTNAPLPETAETKPQTEAPLTPKEGDIYLPHLKALSDNLNALRAGPTLNDAEMKSIRSLVAYVAYDRDIDETVVHSLIESHFNVDDLTKIRGRDYNDLVQFLVDLNVDLLLN